MQRTCYSDLVLNIGKENKNSNTRNSDPDPPIFFYSFIRNVHKELPSLIIDIYNVITIIISTPPLSVKSFPTVFLLEDGARSSTYINIYV